VPATQFAQGGMSQPADDAAALQSLSHLTGGGPAEQMDMEWDSRAGTASCRSKDEFLQAIQKLPVTGEALIGSQQREQLTGFLGDLCVSFGTDNPRPYLQRLKQSGETVKPEFVEANRGALLQNLPASTPIPDDPWEQAALLHQHAKFQSHWHEFVLSGSGIRLYKTTKEDNSTIGEGLWRVRQAITTFNHIGAPPLTAAAVLKQDKELLMAEVTLFIRHDDSMGGKVRPYIARLWYDSLNKVWRTNKMSAFQNGHDDFQPGLMY